MPSWSPTIIQSASIDHRTSLGLSPKTYDIWPSWQENLPALKASFRQFGVRTSFRRRASSCLTIQKEARAESVAPRFPKALLIYRSLHTGGFWGPLLAVVNGALERGKMTRSQVVDTVFPNRPLNCVRRPEAVSLTGGSGRHWCFLSFVPEDRMVRWVETMSNFSEDVGVVIPS